MRKGYSTQGRLDTQPIGQVALNLECRDSMIPVLRSLQHLYSQPEVIGKVLERVAQDVNGDSRSDRGREGMDYWQILVLASVRLGCNFTYDRMQDLAENHAKLRAIMGVGDWDEKTSFDWRRIRDNVCQLRPATIDAISQIIVAEGHIIAPEAIAHVRADSFVMETDIHYPTESSLLRDGIRSILSRCLPIVEAYQISGWRQHRHCWKKVKNLCRRIDRIAQKKGPNYQARMKTFYRDLLKETEQIIGRARLLCVQQNLTAAATDDIFGDHTLQAFIARTERVLDTARRRVLLGECVPNSDKLFSMFEPHTQLYRRGKAGQPNQFGRQVLVFEDSAGFLIHRSLMPRNKSDKEVAVEQTKIVQQRFGNAIKRLSFDRGFHSPENQTELSELVSCLCLPKPGVKQSLKQLESASDEFLAAQQNHSGVESAIGALQSGNGLVRSRDRSEPGFERYLSLAILGRNLHTLGRLLIAQDTPDCEAARTLRKAA